MLAHLSQHTTISSTNDENLLRLLLGKHGQMSNHFLVRELIALSHLNHSIKNEHNAISLGLEDQDVLELTLSVEKHLFDFNAEALAGPHDLLLGEPTILDQILGRIRGLQVEGGGGDRGELGHDKI
jgi:hypothetical protein